MTVNEQSRLQLQLYSREVTLTPSFLQQVVFTALDTLLSEVNILNAVTSAFSNLHGPQMDLCVKAMRNPSFLEKEVAIAISGISVDKLISNEKVFNVVTSALGKLQSLPTAPLVAAAEPENSAEDNANEEERNEEPLTSATSEPQEPECPPQEAQVEATFKAEEDGECLNLSVQTGALARPEPKCTKKPTQKSSMNAYWKLHQVSQRQKTRFGSILTSTFRLPKPSKSKRVKLCFQKLVASSKDLESIIQRGRKLLQVEIARMSKGLVVLRSQYEKEFMKEVDAVRAECLLCPEAFRFETYRRELLHSHYQQHILSKYFVCGFCSHHSFTLPLDLWQHFRECHEFESLLAAGTHDKNIFTAVRNKMLTCRNDLRFLMQINNPDVIIAEYSS